MLKRTIEKVKLSSLMFLLFNLVSIACFEDVYEPPVDPVHFQGDRWDPIYDKAFRNSFDGATIASTLGPAAGLENAIKNDNSRWESQGFNGKTPVDVVITFPDPIEFEKFVFLTRPDNKRGFPLKYQIFVKYNGDVEFTNIKNGQFTKYMPSEVVIDFNETFTNVVEFKFRFVSVIYNYQYTISLVFIGLYHDDTGYLMKDTVFTDRTWSKFRDGFSLDKFNEELNEHNKYVKYYFNEQKILKTAMEDVNSMRPEMIEKDVFKFDCQGNPYSERDRLKSHTVHHNLMTIGRYGLNGDKIELFCEFGNNTRAPVVKWPKSMDGYEDFQTNNLKNGYNLITVPWFRDVSSQIAFMTLTCNDIVGSKGFEFQPKCRVKGGRRYPHYVLFKKDPQNFYDELMAYTEAGVTNHRPDARNVAFKADLTNIITNKMILAGTATGARNAFKSRLPVERGIVKLAKKYEQYPYVYYNYGGFSFTPKGRFFSRIVDELSYGSIHAYMLPDYTGFNCYCLNKPNQASGWATPVYDINQMTVSTDNACGFFHEWGHGMDNKDFVIYEMTNNYFSMALSRYITNAGPSGHDPGISALMAGFYGAINITDANWNGMAQMRQLEVYFGGDLHGKANEFTRNWANYKTYGFEPSKIGNRQHRWIVALSCATQRDLSQHFADISWFNFNDDSIPIVAELKKYLSQFEKPAHPIKYITPSVRAYKGNGFSNNVQPTYISIKQIGTGAKSLTVTMSDSNALKDLQGYEVRDMNKKPILFSMSNTLGTKGLSKVEIVPYDKKLNPGKPIYLELRDGQVTHANRSKWAVKNLNTGDKSGNYAGEPKNIIDGDTRTSYRNGGSKPNGFIFTLNEEVTFNGVTRTRRDDVFGNTNRYKIYCSMNNVNWTQINSNDDTSVLSTDKTNQEFYFFPKTYTAKFIKYEQLSTKKGDSHMGMADFNLINGPTASISDSKNSYPKTNEPLPDISHYVDPPAIPEPTIESGTLYVCYPDIDDQPCYAKFGDKVTKRKSKTLRMNTALYAIDTTEKPVAIEISGLKIANESKVIARNLSVTKFLTIEENSVLYPDYGHSISFDNDCEVDLFVGSNNFPILDVGELEASKIPLQINLHYEIPSSSFKLQLIKGNDAALAAIMNQATFEMVPNITSYEYHISHVNGFITISGNVDESSIDDNKKSKTIAISVAIVAVVVVGVVVASVVIFLKCRASRYKDDSSEEMVI